MEWKITFVVAEPISGSWQPLKMQQDECKGLRDFSEGETEGLRD
jgi:hypothetical protein